MKKLFRQRLLFVSLMTALSMSCKDHPADIVPEVTAPVGKISANIDNIPFEADGRGLLYIGNETSIDGTTDDGTSITIFIRKALAVGKYGVHSGINPIVEITDFGVNRYSSAFVTTRKDVGSVIITDVDKTNRTVSGVFDCTMGRNDGTSKEVTGGSFNKIPYVVLAENSLAAKIDGKVFTSNRTVGKASNGRIDLDGNFGDGTVIIGMRLKDNIQPGAYPIGGLGDEIYAYYGLIYDSDSIVSTRGTLTITKHDDSKKRIEGTFNFETAKKTITEGTFALTYF